MVRMSVGVSPERTVFQCSKRFQYLMEKKGKNDERNSQNTGIIKKIR